MTDTTALQAEIDALLARIDALRQHIAAMQDKLTPLKADIETAWNAFQAVIGPLRLKEFQLRNELAARRELPPPKPIIEVDPIVDPPDNVIPIVVPLPKRDNPDAVALDMLLEFLVRVLDPDINDDDNALIATLQGKSQEPNFTLAEALTTLKDDFVWKLRAEKETLADQKQRLADWENALSRLAQTTETSEERLRSGERYKVWEQFHAGPEAWNAFLQKTTVAYHDLLADLQAERESGE